MPLKFKLLLLVALCFTAINSNAQYKTPKTIRPGAPANSIAASVAAGSLVYKKICISCHQADGGGVQNMNPPLIKTSYVLGDKARLIKIVLNGFSEQVEINDQTYNNVMPAFDFLKDQEVADVLTYVRNSFTNKATAVKADEVTKLRVKK